MAFHLRFKFYIVLVPFILVVMILAGFLGIHVMRLALTRSANHHMAFKAEQLRDYLYNEWTILDDLGLTGSHEYRRALERSLRSYAFSLLRTGTEQVLVFDRDDNLLMHVQQTFPDENPARIVSDSIVPPSGWFEGELLNEDRVGVSFPFSPLSWTIAVTETRAQYFSDGAFFQKTMALVLISAVIILIIFVYILVGLVIQPVERLTASIMSISTTHDYSKRVPVEEVDEIGMLANEFNNLVQRVQLDHRRLEKTARHEADAREMAIQREEEALSILGRVSDFRDEETGRHQKRIGRFSALFATYLGITVEEQKKLLYSAPLHDIGKIGISDTILLKPGPLTVEEFEIMKQHPLIGYELLKDTQGKYLKEGAVIALTHHEKWDGSGYPAGLSGEDIPRSGRIVAIADVLDALFSERIYKSPWTVSDVMDHIRDQRGRHFDPELVDILLDHQELFLQVLLEK